MSIPFLLHILISGIIFYLLWTWQKFFIKLKATVDFSYLWVVIFGSYSAVLLNMHLWRNMLASLWWAFVLSLAFTGLILYLSGRLDEVYFAVGTLALYILSYQLAHNLEGITWWPFGLSWMNRSLWWIDSIASLWWYALLAGVLWWVLLLLLLFFKKTYFYKVLEWRWEREIVITSLGVTTSRYRLVLIVLTTLIAVVWWSLYSFYLLYIDPTSFWISMLILTVTIAFLSYGFDELGTFIVALLVVWWYEWLRFFKMVDPAYIWYFREIVFALLIMAASYWIFKRESFWRSH